MFKRYKGIFAIVINVALLGCGAMPAGEGADEAQVAEKSSELVYTCPSPKSCAGWSAWYNLGAAYCEAGVPGCEIEFCRPCHCTLDGCEECCTARPGPGTKQKQEGFRDCTLQNGQRCREYRERTLVTACGC